MPKPATEAMQRLAVSRVEAFMASAGLGVAEACLRAGVSRANYYRWTSQGSADTPVRPAGKRGRPSLVELTEQEIHRLRYWRLIRDSVPLALSEFCNDELCRPEVRQLITQIWQKAVNRHKRPSWPMSIRRALHVTEAERAVFRGEKAIREIEVTERRGAFWTDEQGNEWPMAAGTIYESDDESENEPFRYFDPTTGTERLGRQSLKTIDTHSLKWLGFTHVGRERDAYRVEDIADHFADIVRQCGLPILWRVERGVWDNNWLFGIELEDGTRWGGLDTLFHIRQKFSSRGKANVEGSFNFAQDLRAHGPDGGVTSIGRHRGEFQNATREYLRAQAGNEDDLKKFWSIAESAEAVAMALARFNAMPKQRHALGGKFISPDEVYGTPAKREVPADQWWRFLPVKRAVTVKQGAIEIKVPHYPVSFRFRVNGAAGLHFDHGHKLLIAFHPGHPEQGMQLFNAETGAKNRDGLGFGERIGQAEWLPDRAQENLAGTGDFSGRKIERAAVRREFRAIVAGTARAVRKSHAQDGLGNVLRTASGQASDPAPARVTRGGLILPDRGSSDPLPTTRATRPRSEPALDDIESRLRDTALVL